MEEALAMNQLDTANLDMLPRLVANAGYTWRDQDLITRSVDSVTGLPSLANPYISSERSHAALRPCVGVMWMSDRWRTLMGSTPSGRQGISTSRSRNARTS